MVATKIFSITLIVALLASSVQSAKSNCPTEDEVKSLTSGDTKKYIVMLKTPDQNSKSGESSVKAHYSYLEECFKRTVERVADTKRPSEDRSTIRDFSIGSVNGYSTYFTEKLLDDVRNRPEVRYVEEDQKVTTNWVVPRNIYRRAVDNNPQKNDDRIDQAKRPLDGKFTFPDSAGEGVNIFVIDTGIRTDHTEFGTRAKFGGSFCDGCNDEDENGHGTHVSSIAAGKTLGVARKANIIGIRVLDANGSGSNSFVIDGMTAVIDQHKKSADKKSVVNMSLGGGFSQAVNDVVKEMTDAGIHVVVAAGNESADSCKSSPASAKSAITVGATNEDDEGIAFFSNFGACNDIFAPGSNIRGADAKSKANDDTVVFSGTSQATPHVAGTVALIIAKDGNQSPDAMAKSLIDLSTKGVVKGLDKVTPNNFLRVPSP